MALRLTLSTTQRSAASWLGERPFELTCDRDLEGIVAKHRQSRYTEQDGNPALIKIKDRKEAEDTLCKAKKAITCAENKAKRELYTRGVKAQKDKKARLTLI